MAGKSRKKAPRKKTTPKRFHLQLGWAGMGGVLVVCCCLFLWMFLLGVWAGQTILFPTPGVKQVRGIGKTQTHPLPAVEGIRPDGRKRVLNKGN